MSHSRMTNRLRAAISALEEAESAFEIGDAEPNDADRVEIAQLLYVISSLTTLLQRRYGITVDLMPGQLAPDWRTRQEQAHELVTRAITLAMNYRPGTERGAAVASTQNFVEHLRRATVEFRRGQMEAIAS